MKPFEDFWEEAVWWGRLKLFPEVLDLIQKKLETLFVQVLRADVGELIFRGNIVNWDAAVLDQLTNVEEA